MKKEKSTLRHGEKAFRILLLLFSLFVLYMSYGIAGFSSVVSAGAFPVGISIVLIISTITIIISGFKSEKADAAHFFDEIRQAVEWIFPLRIVGYIVLIGVYAMAIERIHFLPATTIFLFLSFLYFRSTTVLRSVLVSVGTVTMIYFVFLNFFRVVVP